jgi:pimeloyl-ACP methyl ester carboxylesterase
MNELSKGFTDVPAGRYRHYKGKEYTVLGVAKHSETEEELIVYRQEYGDRGLWVRPKMMFLEMVKVDGKVVPRFQYLGTAGQEASVAEDYQDAQQADQVLHYLNERAFFPRLTTVPATFQVRAGSAVLGCHVLRSYPDAGWVIYFHGNGELAAECVDYCGDLFVSAGVNACFVEYRGYGQSEGEPGLVTMLGDGEQVVKALGAPAQRVVAFGRSLGSLYAIELARRLPELGGLILESAVASLTDIWPVKEGQEKDEIDTALDAYFDQQAKLSNYTGPLLVLHAAGDRLVPQSHAQRLYQWGGGTQKRLAILPQGDHNTILPANVTAYVAEVERFVQRLGLGVLERNRVD